MSIRTRGAPADYYAVLGVDARADSAEIRRAYRDLARRLHPDVNRAHDAAERFAAVAEAYDTLSEPARRRAYDASRTDTAVRNAGLSEAASRNGYRASREGTTPEPEPALRGLDVWLTVPLSVRQAAFGVDKTVEVPRRDPCVRCHGSGAAPGAAVRQCGLCHGTGRGARRDEECPRCHGNGARPAVPCPACAGLGRVETTTTFPLHFPGALDDGEVLRIKNEGHAGPQGGPRGDLRVRIAIEPDAALSRRGAEVYARVTVSPLQAARGGAIEVPTLRGTSSLRLPPHVTSGDAFVMRGQGLRLKGKWRRGDQHVTVTVAAAEPVSGATDASATPDVADAKQASGGHENAQHDTGRADA